MEGNGIVSVIIPAYNADRHLERTINSVLAQTYKKYEIIVVDDGSMDGTAGVCQRYSNRVHYIYKPNGGVSRARNRGIRAACGEYIAFLDADDEWKPHMLETLIRHLEEHPDVSAATGAQIFVSGESERIQPDHPKYTFDRVVDYFEIFGRGPNIVNANSAVYRKSVIDQVGGFTPWMRHNEDTEFFIRVSLRTKWYVSSRPLSYYFIDTEGAATEGLDFDQRLHRTFHPRVLKWVKIDRSEKLFYRIYLRNKYKRLAPSKSRYIEYKRFLHDYVISGVRHASDIGFVTDCLCLSLSLGMSLRWCKNLIRYFIYMPKLLLKL